MTASAKRTRPPLLFYCDEASHHDEYMAVGGIVLREERYDQISQDIREIGRARGRTKEVKWENLQKRKIDTYNAYTDLLFSLLDANQVHFHIVIAKLRGWLHSGPRGKDDSISKIYYQLILHRCLAQYGTTCNIHVRPDNGNCTAYLPEMLPGLRVQGHKKYGANVDALRSIECRDSRDEPILWLNDVHLGAIAAHRNGRHLKQGASIHKAEFAAAFLRRCRFSSFAINTRVHEKHLTIWNFQPRERHPSPRRYERHARPSARYSD